MRPEFGVTEVRNVTMASDETKNKLVDTAKVRIMRYQDGSALCTNALYCELSLLKLFTLLDAVYGSPQYIDPIR